MESWTRQIIVLKVKHNPRVVNNNNTQKNFLSSQFSPCNNYRQQKLLDETKTYRKNARQYYFESPLNFGRGNCQ